MRALCALAAAALVLGTAAPGWSEPAQPRAQQPASWSDSAHPSPGQNPGDQHSQGAGGNSQGGHSHGRPNGPGPGGPPGWLNEINRYRVAAGLPAVSEQRSWKSGLVHHLHYLERTPDRFMRGMYASWHMENPASPFYTRNGALEGAAANIGIGGTTVDVIDSWWAAPFHAIGMLRPQLRQVELAYADGWADLDVLKGLDPNLTAPRTPVLFPGPDATTNLRDLGAEVPDSRQSCGWQHRPLNQGLPVIALLPSSPANRLTASLWGPTGKPQSTLHRTLCVVDEHTYRSSDPVYGATGRAILQRDHVVILIPAHPLQIGQNVVRIRQRHHATILWRFNVVP